MKQDLGASLRRLGVEPSRAQVAQLSRYEEVLRTRGPSLGLVSRADRDRVRERHILDCARAVPLAPEAGSAFDFGSGAGLPGFVVAILRPALAVTLVERRARRAGFLEWMAQELALANTDVAPMGVEELPLSSADVGFARALAALPRAWRMASPCLKPSGRLVYFAGEDAEIPTSLPGATSVEVMEGEVLESGGPLVIITR